LSRRARPPFPPPSASDQTSPSGSRSPAHLTSVRVTPAPAAGPAAARLHSHSVIPTSPETPPSGSGFVPPVVHPPASRTVHPDAHTLPDTLPSPVSTAPPTSAPHSHESATPAC